MEYGSDDILSPLEEADTAGLLIKVVFPDAQPPEWGVKLERGNRLTVGRSSKNDIQLDIPAVSRRHLVISWEGKHPLVEDLNSRNGTKLNGQRLKDARTLGLGDCLSLSTCRLLIMSPSMEGGEQLLAVNPRQPSIGTPARIDASDTIQARLLDEADEAVKRGPDPRGFSGDEVGPGMVQKIGILVATCVLALALFYSLL